jgi:hypothetical protein
VRAVLVAAALAGCGFDPGPIGGSLTVTGDVVDFTTRTPVPGVASVSVSGLAWTPVITTQAASFVLDDVKEYSMFHVLAAAPPTHRATFGAAVVVADEDRAGVEVPAVSEAYLETLATAFAVTPSAGRGVLFVRLVDSGGAPRAGVAASALVVVGGGAVDGPYFLDAGLQPMTAAIASSASGWAVYFELDPGITVMGAADGANMTVDMPISPVNAGAVTIADARVTDGIVTLPTNVSFRTQVVPIFEDRGCVGCHQGKREGAELGGLKLDGKADKVYDELMEDPTRVVVGNPDASLLLTMPLREDPPDRHPNITFANTLDPDWMLLRAWIVEGAQEN